MTHCGIYFGALAHSRINVNAQYKIQMNDSYHINPGGKETVVRKKKQMFCRTKAECPVSVADTCPCTDTGPIYRTNDLYLDNMKLVNGCNGSRRG